MEIYFNDKKYKLNHNSLYESFLNEDTDIKQNVDNLLNDENKSAELLKILGADTENVSTNQQSDNYNQEIKNLNNLAQSISNFKI